MLLRRNHLDFIPPPGLIAGGALSSWYAPARHEVFRPWLLRGRDRSGQIRWSGRFRTRADLEAFVWSALTRELWFDREMWRLPAPCWHPEFGELVYELAPSATSLGTGSNSAGTTLILTVGAAVAAGSTVVVGTATGNNATLAAGATVADSNAASYTQIGSSLTFGATGGVGWGQLFYLPNSAALANGSGTITMTKQASGQFVALSAMVVSGVAAAPLDTAVTATATGSSGTPSVVSGTPAVAGELIIGFCGAQDANGTGCVYTQDSTHSFTTPFVAVDTPASVQKAVTGGGNVLNAGTGTTTFAPTLSNSSARWAEWIIGLQPGGGLFRQSHLQAMGTGGPFFSDPMAGI